MSRSSPVRSRLGRLFGPVRSGVDRLSDVASKHSHSGLNGQNLGSTRTIPHHLARIGALVILVATVSGCGGAGGQPVGEQTCDRGCILGVTEQYLEALLANDVALAPLARQALIVENLVPITFGEGLWESAGKSALDFAIHVPDPELQQAGWLGLVENKGRPVILAVKLTLDGGLISQAEHLLTEPVGGNLDMFSQVRPGLQSEIAPEERIAHEELIRIGASYYDALDNNNGALAPFADDCQRQENGLITAGVGVVGSPNTDADHPSVAHGCKSQIDSQAFVYIDRIENRQMIAADPVTGLTMGFSQFRHPMSNLPYNVTLSDGTTSERNAENMPYEPFDMLAAHIFKVGPDSKVHEIEAVGVNAPLNSPTGWE